VVGVCWLVDLGSLEDSGLDGVWLKVDVEVPLLDLFGLRDHSVELLDAPDPLVGLLEETLPDVGHDPLVLSDLCWDADEGAELGWKVNVLALLANLEQWLMKRMDFDAVGRQKVVNHIGPGLLVSVVEDIVLWVHAPLDLMYFVGTVRAVLGHDDCSFELSVDESCIVALQSIVY